MLDPAVWWKLVLQRLKQTYFLLEMKRHRKRQESEQPEISLEKTDNELFAASCLSMFEEETLCDVTLIVGEEKERIRAHKFILITRSEVFRAMFCGNYVEASGEVEIPDIQPDTLKILLRYMYTGDSEDFTKENVSALLYAAEKYRLNGFADKCEQFLMKSLSFETFCDYFNLATQYYKKNLLKECLLVIFMYPSFFTSKQFLTLTSESLYALVKTDYRTAISSDALELYMACIRWAKNRCENNKMEITPGNIRECLGATLYSIPFISMDIDTFSTKVSKENILTDGEKVALFQSILNKTDEYKSFNFTSAAKSFQGENIKCVEIADRLFESHCDDIALIFMQDIHLMNIMLFIPMKDNDTKQYDGFVHLTITDVKSATVMYSQSRVMKYSTAGPEIGILDIKPSIELKANIIYKLSIRFEGNNLKMKMGPGLSDRFYSPDNTSKKVLELHKVVEKVLNEAHYFGYDYFKRAASSFHSFTYIRNLNS